MNALIIPTKLLLKFNRKTLSKGSSSAEKSMKPSFFWTTVDRKSRKCFKDSLWLVGRMQEVRWCCVCGEFCSFRRSFFSILFSIQCPKTSPLELYCPLLHSTRSRCLFKDASIVPSYVLHYCHRIDCVQRGKKKLIRRQQDNRVGDFLYIENWRIFAFSRV